MSAGIVELALVFGAVLGLAIADLIATKRATTSASAAPPEPRVPPVPVEARPRKADGAGKPRAQKPRANGT
jgi:hypothetical protein